MKKILIILTLVLISLFNIGGCKFQTESSFGLTIQDTDFARTLANGKLSSVENAVFQRGEKISFVLLHVSKFKRGSDGLNWVDMDMEVRDPNGDILLLQQSLLGEKGHIDLPNDIATSLLGAIYTTTELEPGTYKAKLTVYDKVGGGSASVSRSFVLE